MWNNSTGQISGHLTVNRFIVNTEQKHWLRLKHVGNLHLSDSAAKTDKFSQLFILSHNAYRVESTLQDQISVHSLNAAVIVLQKDNTPFNCPILNSCSLKTVSSTDAYLNLDDCILHYSPLCSLNFVHIVRIVRLTLHFILCTWFYVLLLHSICNSMHMTCLIKRLQWDVKL